jgi:hypothetical protein
MTPEPSKLARLVVVYHQKIGRYIPKSAMRLPRIIVTQTNGYSTGSSIPMLPNSATNNPSECNEDSLRCLKFEAATVGNLSGGNRQANTLTKYPTDTQEPQI